LGTPRYASPEQALGKTVGPAADQYSCALVLYEMLSGAQPFTSATTMGFLTQHAQSTPRPLSEAAPGVPAPLAAAVMKGLSKDPTPPALRATGARKRAEQPRLIHEERAYDSDTRNETKEARPAPLAESSFQVAKGEQATSTFAVDVDTASYALVSRFLKHHQL